VSNLPLGLSIISLVVSLVVAYRAEFRGPQIRITLRTPPRSWSVSPTMQTGGKPLGYMRIANLDEPFRLQVAGDCQATIENDGPKGGAIWDIRLQVVGLGDPWRSGGAFQDRQPFSLAGKASVGFVATYAFVCPKASIPAGLKELDASSSPIALEVTYHRSGMVRRDVLERTALMISRQEVATAITAWATENQFDLSIGVPMPSAEGS
jgi:hypothetical protein